MQGATNAFTGTAGHGKNVLSGEADRPFSEIARDYKSRGARWVAAGDFNYGEGSRRILLLVGAYFVHINDV